MVTSLYKNSVSGYVARIQLPELFQSDGTIRCQDGYCSFSNYGDTLTINVIRSKLAGLGTVLLLELVRYAERNFQSLRTIIADSVLDEVRGFYLQLGFRPTSMCMARNNRIVPPPEDGASFASGFFSATSIGVPIYQHGRLSVTRELFNMRVRYGRDEPDWEVSPRLLLAITREKLRNWQFIGSESV